MTNLSVRRYTSIHETKPAVWDQLAGGQGFQSFHWYAFGEKVMSDCSALYLIVWSGETPVAGAALFKIKNEPLPVPSFFRKPLAFYFNRHPLLVCRSPLADTSALLLPDDTALDEALAKLAEAAQNEYKKQACSFLIFDYLAKKETEYPAWPKNLKSLTVSDPGTYMPITWKSFEEYLQSGTKKDRQHYKRSLKQAEESGLQLTKHKAVPDIKAALNLIHNVSAKHGTAPNPWTRNLLEMFSMVDGTWLEVRKENSLVCCGAVLRDNYFQLASSIGMDSETPGAYFLLLYAALQDAFEHNIRFVRLGSGAYDVKRRLGFELEDKNHAMVSASGIMAVALQWM